jgi:hypothetical protein
LSSANQPQISSVAGSFFGSRCTSFQIGKITISGEQRAFQVAPIRNHILGLKQSFVYIHIQVITYLDEETSCLTAELKILVMIVTTEPFGNVGGHGTRGS